jgi:hypothetical protein
VTDRLFRLLPAALLCLPAYSQPERRPTYEPLPPPAAGAVPNLFLHAKVTASGHWDRQSPELAVDGKLDITSHWACENLPVWHQLDLGGARKLSAIRVWPYWGDGRIYQYRVEGSPDGTTWQMLGDHGANSIASTAEGDLFRFEPRELRYVRTTFTGNSRGKESGGHIVEIHGYEEIPASGLTGGVGTTDLRYPPTGKCELSPAADGVKLTAWRGERVSAQVIVQAAQDHANLRLEPGALGAIPMQAHFVRYTLADGKPQGDILDTAEALPLAAGANRPVWIRIDVPRDASPGTHRGVLTVRSDSSALDFPVELEVLATTLPAPADWKFHLDLWQHPEAVARWHDVPAWSAAHFALMEPMMKRLADAGQKTITTTLVHEAWSGQTYDAFPAMIGWTKRKDGTWSYDYTHFDAWVGFMTDRVGMKDARIHCYTMIPWSLKFRYYDEASAAHAEASLRPGTAEYDEYWGRFLRDFRDHLKSKGWLGRTLIGIDERPDELMRGAMATLKKHAPEIGIASAINAPSELTREFADISPILQHAGGLLPLIEERRAAGKKTTYYTCTSPPVPNTFTFSPPAESEWLGLFASAVGMDGYLRWAYNSWVADPLKSTDFTSWPSGDCFLIYPGNRSSVRFERLRDGIEGWEKIRLIREAAARDDRPAVKQAVAALDESLRPFTWERGRRSGVHTADVAAANRAIEQAARAVAESRR